MVVRIPSDASYSVQQAIRDLEGEIRALKQGAAAGAEGNSRFISRREFEAVINALRGDFDELIVEAEPDENEEADDIGAVMQPSGGGHAAGLAPDPGAVAGTDHVLYEDATWRYPLRGAVRDISDIGQTDAIKKYGLTGALRVYGPLIASALLSPTGLPLPNVSGFFCTTELVKNGDTVLADVPGMSFPVEANEWYGFLMLIHGITVTAADWKFAVTAPASPTAFRAGVSGDLGAGVGTASSSTPGADLLLAGSGNESCVLAYGFIKNGANAGNVQLQFAQNTSNASNSAVRANSFGFALRLQ